MKVVTTEKETKINENIEQINKTEENNIQKNKKMTVWKKATITLTTLAIIGITTLLILFYGPISTFRDWWITTAMTTMSHKYLAEWFFDEETINKV